MQKFHSIITMSSSSDKKLLHAKIQ